MINHLSKTLRDVIAERSNDYTFLEKKYAQDDEKSLLLDPFAIPQYKLPMSPSTVSVIIPAYNASESILSCLTSLEQSNFNLNYQDSLQVIVVNDGSTDDTWETLKKSRFSMHLTAVKQTNHGQAQALNTGISVAEGNIIISCDADMILSYYTIDQFVARHQQIPNVLLTGFRMDISKTDLRVAPSFIREHGVHRNSYFTKDERIIFPVPGYPSNMCLTSEHFKNLGYGRGLWMPDDKTYKDPWLLSDLVIGALFSLSKEVFLNVGGYDERLYGWGSTDGLLAAKVISNNQFIMPVYAASGLHISHPFRTKDKQLEYTQNRKKFFEIIQTGRINYHPNWIRRAKDRIIESFTKSPIQTSLSHKRKPNYKDNEFSWNEIDSLLAIGEYSRASTTLSKYSIKNSNQEKLLRLVKILLGIKRYQEAIDILKEVSVCTDLPSGSVIELTMAYAALGNFTLARTMLEKLSKDFPQAPELAYWYWESAQSHIEQGKKYLDQGFYPVALRCFEIALIKESSNKTALKFRDQCTSKLSK